MGGIRGLLGPVGHLGTIGWPAILGKMYVAEGVRGRKRSREERLQET